MSSFAVVDVETTGLHPSYHHRVVEIAVIVLNDELTVEYEWDSLINPHRDVGATDIHGLNATHLSRAPTFADVAGDLLYLLAGRVFVAHNAQFDLRFIGAELERLDIISTTEAMCTLHMAAAAGLPGRLVDCCAAVGVTHDGAHTAVCDARAVAAALPMLWRRGVSDEPQAFAYAPDQQLSRTGRRWTRVDAGSPAPNMSFLSHLVDRLPTAAMGAVDAPPGSAFAYADILDRALEDRLLSDHETEELATVASEVGLTLDNVSDIHRSYLTSLVAIALADGVLTSGEQSDLECVADLLCVDRGTLRALTEAAMPAMRHLAQRGRDVGRGNEFAGMSVCFTGASACSVDGEPLTRARSELLAAAAGVVVAPRVTKALDILVVADPNTLSGKAEKARSYGTRIIGERSFWPSLGINVD